MLDNPPQMQKQCLKSDVRNKETYLVNIFSLLLCYFFRRKHACYVNLSTEKTIFKSPSIVPLLHALNNHFSGACTYILLFQALLFIDNYF